jgi:hypothetical protein
MGPNTQTDTISKTKLRGSCKINFYLTDTFLKIQFVLEQKQMKGRDKYA